MRIIITPLNAPLPLPAAVATGITAQPGGQAGATPLTAVRHIVTSVSLQCGVLLQPVLGNYQWLFNATPNVLLVFPGSGMLIYSGALNAAMEIPGGGNAGFTFDGTNIWYPQ